MDSYIDGTFYACKITTPTTTPTSTAQRGRLVCIDSSGGTGTGEQYFAVESGEVCETQASAINAVIKMCDETHSKTGSPHPTVS